METIETNCCGEKAAICRASCSQGRRKEGTGEHGWVGRPQPPAQPHTGVTSLLGHVSVVTRWGEEQGKENNEWCCLPFFLSLESCPNTGFAWSSPEASREGVWKLGAQCLLSWMSFLCCHLISFLSGNLIFFLNFTLLSTFSSLRELVWTYHTSHLLAHSSGWSPQWHSERVCVTRWQGWVCLPLPVRWAFCMISHPYSVLVAELSDPPVKRQSFRLGTLLAPQVG